MKSQASIIIVQNFGLLQYTFSSYLTENPVVKFKLNIITVFYQLIKILSVCLKKCICEELKIVNREIRCISLFRMLCSFYTLNLM